MKNLKLDKNNALVLIIGILSFINIFLSLKGQNYLSILNSAIGLAGVLFFFLKRDIFRYFIWLWIAAQAVIIDHTVKDYATNSLFKEAIFDLSQIFNIKIGISASWNVNSYGLNFNALVIGYFFLFRNLKTSSLIGKTINLLFLKGNLDLNFEEGIYATITQRVNLAGDDAWLLGELSSPIQYNQKRYDRVLVLTEDGMLTRTFRIVPAGATIHERMNSLLEFERTEWIIIE